MIELGLGEAHVMAALATHLQATEAEKQRLRSHGRAMAELFKDEVEEDLPDDCDDLPDDRDDLSDDRDDYLPGQVEERGCWGEHGRGGRRAVLATGILHCTVVVALR